MLTLHFAVALPGQWDSLLGYKINSTPFGQLCFNILIHKMGSQWIAVEAVPGWAAYPAGPHGRMAELGLLLCTRKTFVCGLRVWQVESLSQATEPGRAVMVFWSGIGGRISCEVDKGPQPPCLDRPRMGPRGLTALWHGALVLNSGMSLGLQPKIRSSLQL